MDKFVYRYRDPVYLNDKFVNCYRVKEYLNSKSVYRYCDPVYLNGTHGHKSSLYFKRGSS